MDAAKRKWIAVLFVLVATTTAGGCTTLGQWVRNGFIVGPNYGRPPAPVAQDWIDADDKRVRTDNVDLSSWWTVFNDPVLNALVNDAYLQNITLREAGFRVLQARAARAITVGNLFPQTQAYNFGYQHNALSKANANTSFIPTRFYDQWGTNFVLSWEIDFWGRYRRAVEAADDDLDASVEGYDDVLVTLLGDVASTYVQARTFERELALVRANIALQRTTRDLAEARFKAGQTSELDLDQAQSNLSQTEALEPQFETQYRVATNALCILLGIPPIDMLPRLGSAPIPTAPTEVVCGIPAQLLTRRPDVRRAERIVAGECARIGIAESEFYPHMFLNGNIGWSGQQLSDLTTPRALVGSIAPNFQWNILNYGRIANNVRLHEARFQEFVAAYQNTVIDANREVENGLIRFLNAQEQVKFLTESVVAAQKAVNVAIAQYKGGIVDFNRVSLLQQDLVQQQDLLAQSQGAICQGLIEVYRGLGGGWQIRCQPLQPANVSQGEPVPTPEANPAEPLPLPAVDPKNIPPFEDDSAKRQIQTPKQLATR